MRWSAPPLHESHAGESGGNTSWEKDAGQDDAIEWIHVNASCAAVFISICLFIPYWRVNGEPGVGTDKSMREGNTVEDRCHTCQVEVLPYTDEVDVLLPGPENLSG